MYQRKVLATSPVAVEYAVTQLGRTLQVPFGAVYDWSIQHLDQIEEAQRSYDSRTFGSDQASEAHV